MVSTAQEKARSAAHGATCSKRVVRKSLTLFRSKKIQDEFQRSKMQLTQRLSALPSHHTQVLEKKLREEMLRPGSPFTQQEVTEAFAEARRERYEALIIPAIKKGLLIVQDRGITTSLAYQPVMSPEISEDFVASLPGNQLAIEWRPDVVILCEVPPEVALSRLSKRSDKSDDAIFEQHDYMMRLAHRLQADTWKTYLQKAGTQFVTFDADQPLALAIKASQHLLIDLIY